MKLAAIVLLVACKHPAPAPAPIAQHATATTRMSDAQFQLLARELARRTHAVVVGWGEMDLDDVDHHDRFATLLPKDPDGNEGTYLLASDDKLYAIAFEVDGRTTPWTTPEDHARPEGEPAWMFRGGNTLHHRQGHRGGYEDFDIRIGCGAVIVVHRAELNDGRAGDKEIASDYPASACHRFDIEDNYGLRQARGPAATLDELLQLRGTSRR